MESTDLCFSSASNPHAPEFIHREFTACWASSSVVKSLMCEVLDVLLSRGWMEVKAKI